MFIVNVQPKFDLIENQLYTFVNPYSWQKIQALSLCEIDKFNIYADGILFVLLNNILSNVKISRYSFDFTSIAHDVFNYTVANNKTIYLIGGIEGVTCKSADILNDLYSNSLKFVGTRNGFFNSPSDYSEALNEATKADFVITAMGTPFQEKFLLDLKSSGWCGTGFTCGGFLDQVLVGKASYYPKWADRLNLRWLYRLYKEPQRLWKRYLIDYQVFIAKFTLYHIKKRLLR